MGGGGDGSRDLSANQVWVGFGGRSLHSFLPLLHHEDHSLSPATLQDTSQGLARQAFPVSCESAWRKKNPALLLRLQFLLCALVTLWPLSGCDTGFGKAVAHKLDSMGFRVIASVLDMASPGAKELRQNCSARLTLVKIDLTKSEDIQKALQLTKTLTADTGLWALVNNAGICTHFGDAELSLMSTYRGCMEVNFFGTVEITKVFLPLLRRSKGRIVTVSSPAGDHSFPLLAAYGSSKAALNRTMNNFRYELKPWGIKVCTIQPGSFKTAPCIDLTYWEHQHKHHLAHLPEELLQDYGEEYLDENMKLFLNYSHSATEDLSPVVDCITDAVIAEHPRTTYFAGKGLWLMYFIGGYMPFCISDSFFRTLFLNKALLPRALRKQCMQKGN